MARGLASRTGVCLGFYSIIAALIGARFFQVLLEWDFYWAHSLDIVKVWDDGLAFQGGQIGWAAVLEDLLLFFGATAWVYCREGVILCRSAQV